MMKTKALIFAACLLVVLSCRKKELPSVPAEDPHFRVSCLVNESPLLLEAGNNGYFMDASWYHDTTGIYVLKADLHPTCAQPCDYGLAVLINDHKMSQSGDPLLVDSALHKGNYYYNDKNIRPELSAVVLIPVEPETPGTFYTWVISDGASPDVTHSGYQVNTELAFGKTYTVTLRTEDNVGCSTEHQQVFLVGNPLQGKILAQKSGLPGMQYYFSSDLALSGGLNYFWEFGDGTVSYDHAPVKSFQPKTGYYQVRLTVSNPAGDVVLMQYQVPGTSDKTCLANFSGSHTSLPNIRPVSKVTVILTLPDGRVFSTAGFEQPPVSRFFVTDISEYTPNQRQEPTRRVQAEFDCLLRNGGEEIRLSGARATLAFAYK